MKKSFIELLSFVSSKLAILKSDIKDVPDIDQKDYEKCRETINDIQATLAQYCNCAPIKLIAGRVEDIAKSQRQTKHKELFNILVRKPSDYKDYGGEVERWKNDNESYPDCSCGCVHFMELEGEMGADWGICTNPKSERQGLLTWEHQNGYKCFEEDPNLFDE